MVNHLPPARGVSCVSWDVGKMTHISVVICGENGEQLPLIAFDFAFVEDNVCPVEKQNRKYATTLVGCRR